MRISLCQVYILYVLECMHRHTCAEPPRNGERETVFVCVCVCEWNCRITDKQNIQSLCRTNGGIVVSHAFFINDAVPLCHQIRKISSAQQWKRRTAIWLVTDVLSPHSKSIRLMHTHKQTNTILLFYCLHYCHADKFITLLFRQTNCKCNFELVWGASFSRMLLSMLPVERP